tara:strand:+ start:1136 stop:1567 length:432 start_codon:yes stop_codon:yes gene_type:complete
MPNKKPLGHSLLRLARLRDLGEGGTLKRMAKFEGLKSLKKPKMMQQKKTGTKEYAKYLTDRGLKPYEFEYRDYLAKAKKDSLKNKIDTVYYKDVTGQYYQQIKKAGKKQSETKIETDVAKKAIKKQLGINKPKMLRKKRKKYC